MIESLSASGSPSTYIVIMTTLTIISCTEYRHRCRSKNCDVTLSETVGDRRTLLTFGEGTSGRNVWFPYLSVLSCI